MSRQQLNLVTYDSPVGTFLVACSAAGLQAMQYEHERSDNLAAAADGFARKYNLDPADFVLEPSPQTKRVCGELDRYFAGKLTEWNLELDWTLTSGFAKAAQQAAFEIPFGSTCSYGELAAAAGNPKAARAAGTAMARNPISIVVPCHRVVRSDGVIGNYGGGTHAKHWLLNLEAGVTAAAA